MKVVDLEILSKFGIQKFFVWGQEEGETFSLQKESLNFELFTRLPSTLSLSLSSSRRSHAGERRERRRLWPPATCVAPRPKLPPRPWFCSNRPSLAPHAGDTRPRCPSARHDAARRRRARPLRRCLAAVPVISRSELRFPLSLHLALEPKLDGNHWLISVPLIVLKLIDYSDIYFFL